MMRNLSEAVSRRDALRRLGGFALFALLPADRLAADPPDPVKPVDPFPHPEPRPGITAANVLGADQLPDKKRVRAAYDAAREYPELFDGLYCVCECSSQGHRSLLACFESKQPTGCWSCQEQAEFVLKRAKEGKTLAEIRDAIDKKWGDSSHKH